MAQLWCILVSNTMSTSYDICVCCFISNRTGATSGGGIADYFYVCRFVYFLFCIGSIHNVTQNVTYKCILVSNTMSILDDIFVCCLLITGVVQLVEQELFTISDVTPLFCIIYLVIIGTDCTCSWKSNYHMITATTVPWWFTITTKYHWKFHE